MHCDSRARGWSTALLLSAALCAPELVRAQVCEDDGGMACEDDAGAELPRDGGTQPAGSGGMGGSTGRAGLGGAGGQPGLDAGGPTADACSCHANIVDEKQGRIDVCTQGRTRAACARFSCERGTVRDQPCDRENVQLCCVMEQRGLVSVLYDDCTHANCVAGFSQQCSDFGGQLHGSDCASFAGTNRGGDGDDGADGCAVAAGGRNADLAALALALALLARRRMLR